MTQPPPERASSGNKARGCSAGPRGREDHPLTDRHLAALLGGAEADLLAAISVLALSGMRFAELRRLRVAQCGRGSFRVDPMLAPCRSDRAGL
jgi:integrase